MRPAIAAVLNSVIAEGRLGFADIGVARNHVRLGAVYFDEIYLELLLE